MPKLKPGHISPTPEEDAAITAAAMADPESGLLTDEEWEAAKPRARVGRPRALAHKQVVTIRLDADLLQAIKGSGPGWQTRINELLRRSVLREKAAA